MKKICLFCLLTIFLVSCGYQTGVIQKAERSYIQFASGSNLDGVTVRVDGGAPFSLGSGDTGTLFQTTPGRHLIQVSRNDTVIVDREIFLQSQATFEVVIP